MTRRGALGPDGGPAIDGLEGALLELSVGAVAHGGHCIAREPGDGEQHGTAGRVVFVRHALPGERVRALVTEEHRTYLRADAIEILEASPRRVTPPCPWAGPGGAAGGAGARFCGGCDLQHAELGYQRELKAAVVREQLVRLGGLPPSIMDRLEVTVRPLDPVPGEPDGLGWRTRVQYTVDSTGRAGLLAHRSHEVVPVDQCRIAHPAVRESDALARRWSEHDTVEVIRGEPATVLARRPGTAAEVVAGPETIVEHAVGRTWRLPPTAFWQVHPSAADALAGAVVELLAPRPGETIWDLYGGAGLFAAALAQAQAAPARAATVPAAPAQAAPAGPGSGQSAAGPIIVVDADPAAGAAARENLRDLPTVTVVTSDVGRALRHPRFRKRRGRPEIVVLDPPRSGAGQAVVTAVAARRPRAVAYVACDPAALARDVRTFRTHGYELAELRAYDLFPQTHHVECVALLIPM